MNQDLSGRAVAYSLLLPGIVKVAREFGYACCVHGSMNRDLDLVLCPWAYPLKPAEDCIEAIRLFVGGHFTPAITEGRTPILRHDKPHGRCGQVIYLDRDDALAYGEHRKPYLDISVMPAVAEVKAS